jgi:hypothetical protein
VTHGWWRRAGIAVLIVSAGCRDQPAAPIVFAARTIDHVAARPCGSLVGCAEIHLSWLEAAGGPAQVSDRVNRLVFELLRSAENQPTSGNTPDLIARSFQRDFQASRQPGDTAKHWILMTSVSIPWRSKRDLLTLDAPTYRYQGGAHAVSSERFRVVDLRTGRALGARDILANATRATSIVERFFRRAKDVPLGESLAEYGWYFDHDQFALPADIGLSDEGVIFHWDPTAIGPYVAGMTTLVVPYDSLRADLNRRVLP